MKKRKINKHKEFAIGTKIEYNGKLYEVVESKHCDNCSIKSFCNASDEYIPTLVVPRDKLISIFGKCSATDRDDKTSVVFIEVPKDIIAVRHTGINFITNICNKLEKENNCVLTSLRGG